MKKRRPDWTTIFIAGIALFMAVLAYRQGGLKLVLRGLQSGGQTVLDVAVLLLAAFLVAGLTQVLVSREAIERWLGVGSGVRGLLLACVAGALIPGGPYVYYPIAGGLLQSGASLGVLVAFVTAKNLWSVSRLPYEFALLGPDLTLTRYALTFILPPVIGFFAEALFGRWLERIRETAP
ncbi:MAG: permease [Anaerolineales bacterium]|jgi:uncharacterized membrane protein YraQ (UPF0718 family)